MGNHRLAGREVRRHMTVIERTLWWCGIICSCGLAYPAYRTRLSKLRRTTDIYLP